MSSEAYRKGRMEDYARLLGRAAKSRGLHTEAFGGKDWDFAGIEFRDRQRRYGWIGQAELQELEDSGWPRITPAVLLSTLAKQGLDVRLNRDIAPSRRQLAFHFGDR